MGFLIDTRLVRVILLNFNMESHMTTTQTDRVEAALLTGKSFSAKQIASMFNVASPTKVISLVRQKGNAVYLNKHTDTKVVSYTHLRAHETKANVV